MNDEYEEYDLTDRDKPLLGLKMKFIGYDIEE
jgi:hypothetical protein